MLDRGRNLLCGLSPALCYPFRAIALLSRDATVCALFSSSAKNFLLAKNFSSKHSIEGEARKTPPSVCGCGRGREATYPQHTNSLNTPAQSAKIPHYFVIVEIRFFAFSLRLLKSFSTCATVLSCCFAIFLKSENI